MIYCRSCGTRNADGSATCTSCGAELVNPYAQPRSDATGVYRTGEKPPNYLVHAILATLCCCLPLGIVSIYHASQVDAKWNAGDQLGAAQSSENAKKWFWIAFGLGIVANLLIFGMQFAAEMGGANL